MIERRYLSEGNGSIPVQQMSDFHAAVTDYAGILIKANLPPQEVERVIGGILEVNRTRRDGNSFINFVAGLTRSIANKEHPIKLPSSGTILDRKNFPNQKA